MAMNNMNQQRRVSGCVAASLLCLALASCVDQWDEATQQGGQATTERAIAFQGNVAGSRWATRADGSVINLNVTSLPETKERTYYRADATGSVPAEGTQMSYHAGIFGAYTGQYTWAGLVKLSNTAFDDRATLPVEFSALSALSESTEFDKKKKDILDTTTPPARCITRKRPSVPTPTAATL